MDKVNDFLCSLMLKCAAFGGCASLKKEKFQSELQKSQIRFQHIIELRFWSCTDHSFHFDPIFKQYQSRDT